MNTVRTRFAPSPTGYMHIGNLRTALYGYLYAKKEGGKFILRLEDTDSKRYVESAVQIIYDTLKDAGIVYDEGPDIGGDFGPYIQSERAHIYREYAQKLVELGGAYYCFCDKERIDSLKDENGVGRYDKHCLHLSKEEVEAKLAAGVPYVIRQNVPEEGSGSYEDLVYGTVTVDYKDIEDGILLKSDGMPTYNFANVIDDHLMGITHVIRGSEYLSSTPKYNLMYDAFGWERPVYIHLPPIMKNAHEKLSKRNGDASYQDLVAKGYIKQAIVNYIALLGWSPKTNQEKMTLARPFLARSKAYGKYDEAKLLKMVKTRVDVLEDIPAKLDFLEEYGHIDPALYFNKKMKSDAEAAKAVLPAAYEVLEGLQDFSNTPVYEALVALAQQTGRKNGQVLWCVRIAVTGRENTPGGASEMAELLGKERCLARLAAAIAGLGA